MVLLGALGLYVAAYCVWSLISTLTGPARSFRSDLAFLPVGLTVVPLSARAPRAGMGRAARRGGPPPRAGGGGGGGGGGEGGGKVREEARREHARGGAPRVGLAVPAKKPP